MPNPECGAEHFAVGSDERSVAKLECLECGAWIMNRRMRKPPAGIAMSNEARSPSIAKGEREPSAVHNVTSGKAVITNSATLRT